MILPNLRKEKSLWKKGYRYIAGADEVGRGALAGPVVAAAVLIHSKKDWQDFYRRSRHLGLRLTDSKQISPTERERILKLTRNYPSIIIKTALADAKTVDKYNIRNATLLAMKRAVLKLPVVPSILLLDGRDLLSLGLNQQAFIGGDAKIPVISLASIAAKVARDALMRRFSKSLPEWGFDIHKGYGTKSHFGAIKRYGPSSIHRQSFLL